MQWLQSFLQAPPENPGGQASGNEGSLAGSTGAQASRPQTSNGSPFQVGDIVEYNSVSQGMWILATVAALREDGFVDLDCKQGVHPSKLRSRQLDGQAPPASATSSAHGGQAGSYAVGAVVEYNSASQGWILAKVVSYDASNDAYALDCKQAVPSSKIRPAVAEASLPPAQQTPSQPLPLGSIGGLRGSGEAPQSTAAPLAPPSQQRLEDPLMNSRRMPPAALPPSGLLPTSAPSQEAPMQLVSVSKQEDNRWHFEVNNEAARMLESFGQRRVSVVTVCGPYRTGKSYLLNLLLGRIQRGEKLFSVGSTTQACTQGLWMWGSTPGKDGSVVVYLDCEGFGSTDSDRTRDCKLMSLCMLLSSVFLLNTKGVLNEGLFNALSLVCHLAEHMEERGQEASKPALIWCLRDFILELEDESGRKITSDEYLEQALHAKPLVGVDLERSRAAKEVREHLLKFFPQRNCVTFVQPIIEEEKLRALSTVPYLDLRPDFRRQTEVLQDQLSKDAAGRPKTMAGQIVGGAGLAGLLRKLCDAINSNQALSVVSAWEQVQHTTCGSLLDELRQQGIEKLQALGRGAPLPVSDSPSLPVADDVLARALSAVRSELYQEWQSRAVGEESTRAEYWTELCDSLHGEERAVERQNLRIAEERLREALADWEAWLAKDGEVLTTDAPARALMTLLEQGLPAKPVASASRDALDAAARIRVRFDGVLKASRAELQLKSSELESKSQSVKASAQLDDSQLEQVREAGRLQGQVAALEGQAKDSSSREQLLQEKLQQSDNALRVAQREVDEANDKVSTQNKIVEDLRVENGKLRAPPEPQEDPGKADKDSAKPKCACSMM